MVNRAIIITATILTAALLPRPASAEVFPLIDSGLRNEIELAGVLRSLYDPTHELRAASVLRKESGWRAHPGGAPAFGYTGDTVWLHFALRNTGSAAKPFVLMLDNEYLNEIELYGFQENRPVFERQSGRLLPFGSREYPDIKYSFSLRVPPGAPLDVYLRVKSHSSLNVPILLMTKENHASRRRFEIVMFGVFFGMFGIIFLMNFIMYLIFRDRTIVAYLVYLVLGTTFMAAFTGLLFKHAWPESPAWNAMFNTFSFLPLIASALVFTRIFLRTRLHLPRTHVLMNMMIGASLACMSLPAFLPLSLVEAFIGGLLLPVLLVLMFSAILRLWLRGQAILRFYLTGLTVYMLFLSVHVFQIFGLAPTRILGIDQMQLPLFGFFLELIFFPLALGDRLRRIIREAARQQANFESRVPHATGTTVARLTSFDMRAVELKYSAAKTARTDEELAARIGIDEADLREYRRRRPSPPEEPGGLLIGTGPAIPIPYAEILYFTSIRNRTILHGENDRELPLSLKEIEARLPRDDFLRVHRRHIVNLQRVVEVRHSHSGRYIAILNDADETEIPVARSHLEELRLYLKWRIPSRT